MKITDLVEADDKVKTATKPDLSAFADDLLGPDMNAPAVSKEQKLRMISGKRKIANMTDTRNKLKDIELPPGAAEKFGAIDRAGLEDEMSDEEAARHAGFNPDAGYEEPKEPIHLPVPVNTIPAVMAKEIAKNEPIEPEYHMVKHLPGYLKNPIRALGRQVFKVFTDTAIEDVQVLANLNGKGPNTPEEVNAVASYLKHHGHEDRDAVINFEKTIPGYKADLKLFRAKGITHMLVQDFAGQYIYSWPSADDVGFEGAKRQIGLDKKQLGQTSND